MARTMYDGITPSRLPASATIVAGYADGLYANLPTLRARYPHATVVSIAVTASYSGAQVLDVETGDATPAQAPGWVKRRRAAGADPSVYCNSSTWPAVRAAFRAAGVAEPHYWIAQYDGVATIPAGAIAKQYRNTAGYDESIVADYWPGVDPAPNPTPEPDMPLTAADAKTLLETDNLIPAPSGAAAQDDAKTNKFYTLATHQVLQSNNSIEANLNTKALLTQVAALTTKVTALETTLAALNAAGLVQQIVTELARVQIGLNVKEGS